MLRTDQEITSPSSNDYLAPHFSHFHPLDGKPALYPFFNEASSVAFKARYILRGLSLLEITELADEASFRIDCFVDGKEYLDQLGYSHQWISEHEKAWFDSEGNCFDEDDLYDLRDIIKGTEILGLVHYVNSPFQDSHLFAVWALMKLSCMEKRLESNRDDKGYCWIGIGKTLFEAQEAISMGECSALNERNVQECGKENIEEIVQARMKEKMRYKASEAALKKNEKYQPLREACQKFYRSKTTWPSRHCAALRIRENIINNQWKWPIQTRIPTVKTIDKWLKDGESI